MLFTAFNSFITYLKYLLAGDSANLQKIKELKKLYKTFKSSKYHFITKDKKITEHFCNKIYSFDMWINIFKSVLDSSLFNIDDKKAHLYLNHFIESDLPENIRNKNEKFTQESLLIKE